MLRISNSLNITTFDLIVYMNALLKPKFFEILQ